MVAFPLLNIYNYLIFLSIVTDIFPVRLEPVITGLLQTDSCFFSFLRLPAHCFSSVCMAVHRHSDSPIAKGTRRDVLLRELLSLHQVVLIDIAVSQIETGIQVSVDHMATHRTHIDPVLELKVSVDVSAV